MLIVRGCIWTSSLDTGVWSPVCRLRLSLLSLWRLLREIVICVRVVMRTLTGVCVPEP